MVASAARRKSGLGRGYGSPILSKTALLFLSYVASGIGFSVIPDVFLLHLTDSNLHSGSGTFELRLIGALAFAAMSSLGIIVLNRRAQSQAALGASATAVSRLPVGVAILDSAGFVKNANEAFSRLVGCAIPLTEGRTIDGLLSDAGFSPIHHDLLPSQGSWTHALRGQGLALQMMVSRVALGPLHWIASLQDVTEVEELRQRAALLARALDIVEDGVMIAEANGGDLTLSYTNDAVQQITGFERSELLGQSPSLFESQDRAQPEIRRIREALRDSKPITATLRNYRKSGEMFLSLLRLAPVLDGKGKLARVIGTMRDVTQATVSADALSHARYNDGLTGLLNRAGLLAELGGLLERHKQGFVLFAKINIQSFHGISTTWGFEAADALLIQIGKRLTAFRGSLVARLHADNFAFALPLGELGEADVLSRLQAELSREFIVPGVSLRVHFRIGYTLVDHHTDVRQVVRQGSAALHEANRERISKPYAYNAVLDREIRQRIQISGDLYRGVEDGNFILHYQPKVELASGQIIGAEALIRWEHPTFGLQLPGRFIPSAEHSGLVLPIGSYAIRQAAKTAAKVKRTIGIDCPIAANVSVMQFRQSDVPSLVERVLTETGLEPHLLMLEITESLFEENSGALRSELERIKTLGVGISIDDFGTGYSSLRYLANFPISEIKIDASFVAGMWRSPAERLVIEAIIRLGRDLNVDVTAEGIESGRDRKLLIEMGCEKGQGYLFSMPLIEEDFLWLLAHQDNLYQISECLTRDGLPDAVRF